MATKYIRGSCKCCCNEGSIIPRWQNVTKVRRSDGTTITDDNDPFPRKDTAEFDGVHSSPACNTLPPGECGAWLAAGDYNGVSAQEVEDTVDDIIACATGDSTHATVDHNCYFKNGDTVDMRSTQRRGNQTVLAQKFWHGAFNYQSNDACSKNPNIAPDQIKYLKETLINNYQTTEFDIINTNPALVNTQNVTQTSEINSKTGIEIRTRNGEINDYTQTGGSARCGLSLKPPFNEPVTGSTLEELAAALAGIFPTSGDPDPSWSEDPSMLRQGQKLTINSSSYSSTGFSFSYNYIDVGITGYAIIEQSITLTLSDPYTSQDCLADWENANPAWDLSDLTLAKLRTDEQLANLPLIVFDEVGPSIPDASFSAATMDDYSSTQNEDDSWPQRDWLDPSDYIWKYPNGSINSAPEDFTGGATLLTPRRTGEVVSHTQAGSDRHFWPGFPHFFRKSFDPGDGSTRWEWFLDTHGAFSESPLPPVAMRWQSKNVSQYDAIAFTNGAEPPQGNLPQHFLRQKNGVLIGTKFVQATQSWPSVNYGEPCADLKYAVDQASVCCVLDAGSGTFTVKATGEAALPLATGGLAANDYVIRSGDGVYKISSISDDGMVDDAHQFTLSVGAKIDDPPTAGLDYGDARDGVDWIGKLRFPTAPGICGRVAVTTSFDSDTGLVTITPEGELPYLRLDPTTGTITIDLYDASMTSVVASAVVTRVSDDSFTFTHAAIPSAVWMTGAGIDWTQNDRASKRTGVHLEYTFDQRKAAAAGIVATAISGGDPDAAAKQAAYEVAYGSYPPTWYADTAGCLNASINQFNYGAGKCAAMVGIVPFYSPPADTGDDSPTPTDMPPGDAAIEDFSNQVLFPTGTIQFDDVFGACFMGGIALTMPDPFWQRPFKPDCGGDFTWIEDDGSGQADTDGEKFFAHHPLVEASSVVPSGKSLPAGISLYYDPTENQVAPPFYPNGIHIGNDAGDYMSVETDWGLAARACAAIRFKAGYLKFVKCP